jgi:hypothetical protein
MGSQYDPQHYEGSENTDTIVTAGAFIYDIQLYGH